MRCTYCKTAHRLEKREDEGDYYCGYCDLFTDAEAGEPRRIRWLAPGVYQVVDEPGEHYAV